MLVPFTRECRNQSRPVLIGPETVTVRAGIDLVHVKRYHRSHHGGHLGCAVVTRHRVDDEAGHARAAGKDVFYGARHHDRDADAHAVADLTERAGDEAACLHTVTLVRYCRLEGCPRR